ncbi:MAG TPA: hypothetical protein VNO84_11550 [Burkholderiaceae bacterium]|nr:hypothetical protein [Burkholderiaceae bacterium]
MDEASITRDQGGLPEGLFQSRTMFRHALRGAFAQAAAAGAPELWCCDVDFAQWPLGEREVVESLTAWAYSHRKLVMLASHYDEVVRRHPRWVQWRRHWGHIVTCRSMPELLPENIPGLCWVQGLLQVRLVEATLYRGVVERQPGHLRQGRELLDEVWWRSIDAFPVTTLGL